MAIEIELKYWVSGDAKTLLETRLLPSLDGVVSHSQHFLSNDYYDTKHGILRQHDCGLRIRGRDGQFEQTLKTPGKSLGGLQQRPEYNVALDSSQLVLSAFAPAWWPTGINTTELQGQLQVQFTTQFTRDAYFVTLASGSEIEIVFDNGVIIADQQRESICEIELELISGDTGCLFTLAEALFQLIPGRMGHLSKAARGYGLLTPSAGEQGQTLVALEADDTVDMALRRSLHYALAQWQQHEHWYASSASPVAMVEIISSIRLLHHLAVYYSSVISSSWLSRLATETGELLSENTWFDDFVTVKTLASRRGIFTKTLDKYADFSAYIAGRKTGLLAPQWTQPVIFGCRKNNLQLMLIDGLLNHPWQSETSEQVRHAAKALASEQLEQQWLPIFSAFSADKQLSNQDYVVQYETLQRAYYTGVLVGQLFSPQTRKDFRAPWLDMLSGIEELRVLDGLVVEVCQSETADSEALLSWVEQKRQRLLAVLEHTRSWAMKQPGYW